MLGTPKLQEAIRKHGDLARRLPTWLKIAQEAAWTSLDDVRKSWRDTDAVAGHTVFNIKGNRYRLIARVNYSSQTVIIEQILTHAEYDKENWKK